MPLSFFVDAMLGSLAKWLRIIGYDVILADNEITDRDILLALKEERGRILLTRDKMLAERALRADLRVILLDSDSLDNQMFQLQGSVEIDAALLFTRCPHCGAVLESISKEKAKNSGMVPEGSLQDSDMFWKCPSCGRYYWKGSHWPKIIKRLREWGIAVDGLDYS